MLACSDGLQCYSFMPCRHQKMSFLYSGTRFLFSFLKWNWGLTDAPLPTPPPPILYIARRFIVQGYSPHKFFKCAYCVDSKREKIRRAPHWLDHNRTLPPRFTSSLLGILCRTTLHYGPLFVQHARCTWALCDVRFILCWLKQNWNK